MKRIRGLLILCVTAAMMFVLAGCGKTTVNLNKYVTIVAEGYDSMGTAYCDFDYDAFEEDYSKKIKVSKNNRELNSMGLLSGESPAELLLDFCVSKNLDQTSALSNGDIVTLKWDCKDSMADEYFNAQLDYSDIQYTVKGLEEVGKFNPFDYVSISFSGISPNGSIVATPDYNKAEMQYICFSADKTDGLKVGDSVTVTASISGSVDSFVENFGTILEKTEETYTVDGLAYYVSDFDSISDDMKNKMDKQLRDAFNAHAASSWEDMECIQEFDLLCNYLLTLKDGMWGNSYNTLYYVYKVTIDTHDGPFTYYWYGYFDDIMVLADGTCSVDLSKYVVSESANVWGMKTGDYLECDSQHYYVAGFADLDSFFNQHIVSKIENYEYKQINK